MKVFNRYVDEIFVCNIEFFISYCYCASQYCEESLAIAGVIYRLFEIAWCLGHHQPQLIIHFCQFFCCGQTFSGVLFAEI